MTYNVKCRTLSRHRFNQQASSVFHFRMFDVYITNFSVSFLFLLLRIHWRLSTILKTRNKSAWSNVFWYVKIWIFWKCIQYSIHWDKTQILKKFPLDKINGTKMPSFFFRELELITALLLICDSYMSWKHKVCLSKTVCGIFHFRFRFVFIKVYIFFQQNTWTLWL